MESPDTDPLVELVFQPLRDLLGRYRGLAARLETAIAALSGSLGDDSPPAAPRERPEFARVETPTSDLTTLLEFQERLAELDGVMKVTVAGSTPGRSSFIVELAPEARSANRVVCSNCGKVISEGVDPPSHGLCDDCRSRFGH